VCVLSLTAGATAAGGASALPTLNLALTGTKGISVSGAEVSGAVNVVSTFSGRGQGQAALVRLNPNVPPAQALAQGFAAVQRTHGDLNALTPLGDSVTFDAAAPSSAQTVLTPGNWVALNITGQGAPAFKQFTVSKSGSPAALPAPGATVRAIEFGFRGATTLHRGQLVRFENDGYLVHMIEGIRVKNLNAAKLETTALRSGKQKLARALALGIADFAGPLSPGGTQQEAITAKSGVYVLACFMDTQDGREHIVLGMERTIRVR
jgi:hypothetical protein